MHKDIYKELETLEDGNIGTYEEYMDRLDHIQKSMDYILNNTAIDENYKIDEIVDFTLPSYKNVI